MIIPVNKYLLVKVIKKSVNEYGVIRTKENEAQECGEVVAREVSRSIHAPPFGKKGDIIYFKSYSAVPIDKDGVELHFVREDEVLGYEK